MIETNGLFFSEDIIILIHLPIVGVSDWFFKPNKPFKNRYFHQKGITSLTEETVSVFFGQQIKAHAISAISLPGKTPDSQDTPGPRGIARPAIRGRRQAVLRNPSTVRPMKSDRLKNSVAVHKARLFPQALQRPCL
ncbi:MAG: hypothetical protein PHC98_06310, partial [Syntrophotalea acetylenica]|nr:hypothetical protein [Syntrophotalea acetylenica]